MSSINDKLLAEQPRDEGQEVSQGARSYDVNGESSAQDVLLARYMIESRVFSLKGSAVVTKRSATK